MIIPNWANIKIYLNNTFRELRREVNNQINQEIKRAFPTNPRVENHQREGQQQNLGNEGKNDQQI